MDGFVKIPAQWWANKAKLMLGQDFNRKGTENKTEIIGMPARGAVCPALVPHLKKGTLDLTRAQRRRSSNGEQLLHKGFTAWR